MINQEILTKAIEKVLSNGFIFPHDVNGVIKWKVIQGMDLYISVFIRVENHHAFDANTEFEHKYSVNDLLFDHGFAKAFWGEEPMNSRMGEIPGVYIPSWKYFLQEIVIEENRVKYLEKFL